MCRHGEGLTSIKMSNGLVSPIMYHCAEVGILQNYKIMKGLMTPFSTVQSCEHRMCLMIPTDESVFSFLLADSSVQTKDPPCSI